MALTSFRQGTITEISPEIAECRKGLWLASKIDIYAKKLPRRAHTGNENCSAGIDRLPPSKYINKVKKDSPSGTAPKLVLVIGNVFFGRQMIQAIAARSNSFRFIAIDTKKKLDVIRYLYHLPRADLVFSVSATLQGGRALKAAVLCQKPVLQEFIGCDTTQAVKDKAAGKVDWKLLRLSTFFAGAPWLSDELASANIKAEFASDFVRGIPDHPTPLPTRFSVLTYVGAYDEELYGMDWIVACAEALPEISFRVAGISASRFAVPENITFLGWTEKMESEIRNCTVFLRLTRHDGMGHTVLEALGLGRWVIRTNEMPGTFHVTNELTVIELLRDLADKFNRGELKENHEGHQYVQTHFNRDKVTEKLESMLNKASNNRLS